MWRPVVSFGVLSRRWIVPSKSAFVSLRGTPFFYQWAALLRVKLPKIPDEAFHLKMAVERDLHHSATQPLLAKKGR
jgi:hypothetical protein